MEVAKIRSEGSGVTHNRDEVQVETIRIADRS